MSKTVTTKECKSCNTVKNLGEFSKDSSKKDKRTTQCKACRRQYRKDNAKVLAEANKRYKQKPESRFRTYVSSAKSRGFEWKLTLEEFLSFWKKPCDYCGGDIVTIGLDRINPSLPYQIDNVGPCCFSCNRMKSDLTSVDFSNHIKKIHTHLNKPKVTKGKT